MSRDGGCCTAMQDLPAHLEAGPARRTFHVAIVSAGAVGSARAQQTEDQPIGLEGNCPVCIVEANKWEKGSPYYKAIYDRVTYYFPNDSLRQKFVASPAKYVPALGGDSVIS